jgi:peptide deformylase
MLNLKIVQAGHPVLRHKARALTPAEIKGAEIRQLIDLMRETMRDAPGVGLAAPQIGLPLRLAVIEDVAEMSEESRKTRERELVPFHVIINPEIELDGESIEFYEGCLSLDGFMALVARSRRVRVKALNEKAQPVSIEASGWYARILQHEIDHLNGTMYIDRMYPRTLCSNDSLERYGSLDHDLVHEAKPIGKE